ncbi:MAG: hypothetical protein ACI4UJ_05515 [Candidatus Cryptobacteroides sp.]
MEDWTRLHNCLKEATVAGYRLIGTLDKAIRRMSPETSRRTKVGLDSALENASLSVSQLEDLLFTEASVEECIGMCDRYQEILFGILQECGEEGIVRNTLEDSSGKAFIAMCNLRSAVDGYRQIGEEEDEGDWGPLQTEV